ncbi:hypothetical protein M404DRAFT_32538 [Pisolithus tinctorius Marx 270]|uniref:Uncharacterized protein n=1 Tax=Pisolithus tinctorius Marx 270 TaxID=870435 RepID=A0A0C3N836_PISTI|nr:hypothetical protein M404DRAFT_32538 [Pisolithus tinctorius Marx 270]
MLVISGGALAASSAYVSLEADVDVVVFARGGIQDISGELQCRALEGESAPGVETELDLEGDIDITLPDDTYLAKTLHCLCLCNRYAIPLSLVPHSEPGITYCSNRSSYHIPINTAHMPTLCDLHFVPPHVHLSTGAQSSMQFGAIDDGEGCRLVSRMQREVVLRAITILYFRKP